MRETRQLVQEARRERAQLRREQFNEQQLRQFEQWEKARTGYNAAQTAIRRERQRMEQVQQRMDQTQQLRTQLQAQRRAAALGPNHAQPQGVGRDFVRRYGSTSQDAAYYGYGYRGRYGGYPYYGYPPLRPTFGFPHRFGHGFRFDPFDFDPVFLGFRISDQRPTDIRDDGGTRPDFEPLGQPDFGTQGEPANFPDFGTRPDRE